MESAHVNALEAAIDILGSQTAVARVVGRTPQAVSEIVRRGAEVPAKWCIPIEQATGGKITRHDLRPDLYPDEPSRPDSPPPPTEGAAV